MSNKSASIPGDLPREKRRSAWPAFFACLALVLAGLAAYSDSFHGPFIFDDETFVNEPSARTFWPVWRAFAGPRPVVQFSLALCASIGGADEVLGYHIFNVAVHLLAALALFGIVRRTLTLRTFKGRFSAGTATGIAVSAALLWELHPLQTEAVTYVVQRAESLMGLFYLLTLYCFIRSAGSPRAARWQAAAVATCLLGMGCKEVMVSAPLMVLLYDRIFIGCSFGEIFRRRWKFYLALAATWLALGRSIGQAVGAQAATAGFHLENVSPLEYARTEFGVILHYLRLAFLPTGLCLDYGWGIANKFWEIAPGVIVVGGLLAAMVWAILRHPMWGFAGAWFYLILAPTSSILPIRDLAFEHRMYLPLTAVVVTGTVAAYLLLERLARGRARGAIAACLVVAIAATLGTLTFLRNRDYASGITIWKDATEKSPENARAWTNLGVQYMNIGQYAQAISCLDEAIHLQPRWSQHYIERAAACAHLLRFGDAMHDADQAIAMEPTFAKAWYGRGSIYFQTHRFAEAVGDFSQAIERDPNYFDAIYNRGKAYASLNRPREAVQDFDRAIKLEPGSASAWFNRGAAYALLGRTDQAIGDFARAIELKPRYAEAYNGRGQARTDAGRPLEALADFDKAIELKPDYAEAYYNRGVARADAHRLDGALSDYDKAIELNPRFSEAYNNRGRIYGEADHVAEAIRDFTRAIELKPANAEPHFNRAVMYYRLNEFDKALADVKEFQRLGGKPDPDPEFLKALYQASRRPQAPADGRHEK